MNNLTIYAFICGAVLLLMGMGLGFVAMMPGIDRWSKRFFIAFFGVLFLNSCFSFIEINCLEVPGMAEVEVIADFGDSLLSTIPLLMLTVFLLHCCGEDWRSSGLFRSALALYGVYFIMLVAAQFNTLIYSVMPDGHLKLGPLYPLSIALLAAIALLNLAGLIRRRRGLTGKSFYAILIALLPLTAVLSVHMFTPVFPLIEISLAISALSMYGIILSDQIEQYLLSQQEIAHQNASILVLQMRPHFIHNTLMSIYYLCEQNPREAQRVTLNFNTYLEKNLTALAGDKTIPFSEELEHTRAYLNVEQALYDENLFVEYDTPHIGFRVPPLTLQPIVENAVKHALDPDSEPVRISIRTRKLDSGSEIIVSDNGPGFEPSDDDSPHIALKNIRQRLELMCGGEMLIMSREGGGTVVKLMIPQNGA